MGSNYAGLITDLTTWGELDPDDENFVAALPTIIEMAEERCYRDLDLLSSVFTDDSATTTGSSRSFTLPTSIGRFIDIETVTINNVLCTPVSVATILALWTSDSVTGAPVMYARKDDTTLLIAPPPASALAVSVRGTIRPTALSADNTETWLTLYAYDLFFTAAMVALTGYLRDWGAQSDDPRLAVSWEGEYAKRLPGAQAEEIKKRL